MDIIDFFRSIDGILYYVILFINTILIFAIVGYLGEKNNQKIIKMSYNTPVSNNNGAMDFSSPEPQRHNEMTIPTVEATAVINEPVASENASFGNIDTNNQATMLTDVNQMSNANMQGVSNPVNQLVAPGSVNQVSNTNMQGMPNNVNQPQAPVNNGISSNEEAPAVLVINSQNTNMPN